METEKNNDEIFNAVRECQVGKLDRFGLIYNAYYKRIYEFIYYKSLHKETAEDLVSKTFFKAMERINQFDPERAEFLGWLYAIARNNVRDHYRALKADANIEDILGMTDGADLEIDSHNRLMAEKIKGLLKILKPEQREIVKLRIWSDLPFKEIAAITGTSPARCKMAFHRAIMKLREEAALLIASLLFLFT